MKKSLSNPSDRKERMADVREARHAGDQYSIVMATIQESQDAKAVDDAAKQHLVQLLVDEGMFHCFSLNMRAVARTFR